MDTGRAESAPAVRATVARQAPPASSPSRIARLLAGFAAPTLPRYAAALGVVVVAALGSYFAGLGLSSPHDQFDLKIYDAAVRFWASGNALYEYSQPDTLMGQLGFTYPPFAAVLMTPMTLLSWPAVQSITVIAIALACAGFCWLLLQDTVRMRGPQALLIVGVATSAAFLFEPVRENISYGQVNLFLGLLIAGDFLLVARRFPKFFGVCIGIAAAIKLTPAIFVLYLILTKRYRPAIVAIATFAVLSIGVAVVAWHEVWSFFTSILWDTSRVGVPDNVFNQSINGVLARLSSPALPSRAIWLPLALGVLVFGMWRAVRLYRAGDDMAGMTLTGLVALMVTPISWTHHAIWVAPAVLILGQRAWELHRTSAAGPADRRTMWSLIALGLFGCAWIIESHHYVTDRTRNWSVATWMDQVMAALPVIWCLLVIAVLPARQLLPAWRSSS